MHASNTYRTARQVFCPFKLFQNYFSLFREGRSESPCVLTRPGMQNLRIVGLEKLPWKTRLREKTSRLEGGGGRTSSHDHHALALRMGQFQAVLRKGSAGDHQAVVPMERREGHRIFTQLLACTACNHIREASPNAARARTLALMYSVPRAPVGLLLLEATNRAPYTTHYLGS